MSIRIEFPATIVDGRIELPAEAASRLRLKGISRVRVVLSTVVDEERALDARGIDAGTIDRVAAAQKLDRDVASLLLGGEGAAAGRELGRRLGRLAGEEPR